MEDPLTGLLGCILSVCQVLVKQNVRITAMLKDKNTSSVCYSTLEVESSRLAVEALDLSNSIKAFSER